MWPPWLKMALLEQANGVKEIPGAEHAQRIIEYHATTTLQGQADEIPWCSSFVNWCIKESGTCIEGTNSARARSWLEWGIPLLIPPIGAIAILRRGGSGQPGPSVIDAKGHVGFYVGQDGSKIEMIGGNQSNKVCTKKYSSGLVLGYRWPI